MTFKTAAEKYQYVNQMFARIAHRYDTMNRIMTLGQDKSWRCRLVEQAELPPGGLLLDLATGTGDIAFEALRQQPQLGYVVGADYTLPMMHVGQQRWAKMPGHNGQGPNQRLSWSGADALRLPFSDNSFDAVASGFLMRNVVSVSAALAEQVRVCKAGGRVLILEIPRPPANLFGQLFRLYFHNVVPVLGGFISGQREAYSYLPASADAFLRPDELTSAMRSAGLNPVNYEMLMVNTVALHVGVKS
ncbi:MAG TPA: ubiquinone/menaquinone biosynthesis methyltransferase [Anaerolineae bacterium]|nr:ubiquinone/menaquinone biosynthesis methyltransferase [Anaerolineae bacterium]HMR63095.1 ubiquinone/menaquinone biosynthesis methyltransferase [Anaerolineae bacterium]